MDSKEYFARMVSGLEFVGPDLTFIPKENTFAYGFGCAVPFVRAMLTFCEGLEEKEELQTATACLKPAIDAFSLSADRNTPAGQGFLDGMDDLRALFRTEKAAA